MTPVKKVLDQHETEDQQLIENNSNQQQFIQLKASFTIQKVYFFFLKIIFIFIFLN